MSTGELRGLPLFEGLDDAQLRTLAEAAAEHRFAAGEELFTEGQPANVWWVLLEGSVSLVRHTGAEETVEWVFARDLLAEGLHRPTGTGDVRVWPSRSHGQGVVCIALSSPEGEALLEAPARALESFLKRTDAAVPPGTEHRHFDLDQELSHILAES